MLYQRSLEIEQRLADVRLLVRRGQYSTPMIAAVLHVSVPTVLRNIMALRERGHDILAARRSDGSWGYTLRDEESATSEGSHDDAEEPGRRYPFRAKARAQKGGDPMNADSLSALSAPLPKALNRTWPASRKESSRKNAALGIPNLPISLNRSWGSHRPDEGSRRFHGE